MKTSKFDWLGKESQKKLIPPPPPSPQQQMQTCKQQKTRLFIIELICIQKITNLRQKQVKLSSLQIERNYIFSSEQSSLVIWGIILIYTLAFRCLFKNELSWGGGAAFIKRFWRSRLQIMDKHKTEETLKKNENMLHKFIVETNLRI
jgi:hypothetical protein